MRAEVLHTSVGCNRAVNSLDWGPTGLIAFAAHHAVVLYSPEEAKIVATLHGHTGRVNCVRWISAEGISGSALCSGAADGTIRVWEPGEGGSHAPLEETAVIEGHGAAVSAIECYSPASGPLLLFSCAGDHTVKVWQSQTTSNLGNFTLRQTISVGSRLANCVSISPLPRCPGWILIAVGVDRTIKLMLAPPGGEFQDKFTLLGHQDWVRSLSFMPTNPTEASQDIVLASGSQDRNIRIWRAKSASPADTNAAPSQNGLEDITRFASKHTFSADQQVFTVGLEAVLLGHEDWVHSIAWEPWVQSRPDASPRLLSASMDRTMMIWRPDNSQPGLWMSEQSLGDAGTNALGYFGGVFSPAGDGIVAHGFSGALHLWRRTPEGQWQAARASGGHFAGVVDCAWAFGGDCLMTASMDQTVRVHVCSTASGWYELARPQIHGHDMSCVAPLPGQGNTITSFRYVSGAEEKILRVFQAPSAFSTSLLRAQGKEVEDGTEPEVAFGATVAALGLSNKAVYQGEDDTAGQEAAADGNYDYGPEMAPNPCPRAADGPPFEEHLAQGTLWPETRKVFGHGNDLITVAANASGTRVATACRAQNAATAAIRVWDTSDWSASGVLKAHTLTVTALEFSPDDRFLLSASRDRSFALHSAPNDGAAREYELVVRHEKAHDRIIWGVSWMSCSSKFVTCSRDKTVKLWEISAAEPYQVECRGKIVSFSCPVTSVAMLQSSDRPALMACGLEDGEIGIWELQELSNEWRCQWQTETHNGHCSTVRRLSWHPASDRDTNRVARLASCGDDHKLRVYAAYL